MASNDRARRLTPTTASRWLGIIAVLVLPAVFAGRVHAEVVGVVAHHSGVLAAHKASGAIRILGVKSQVEGGDTLVTSDGGYAQIRFIDNQQVTLRPNTQLRIDEYRFSESNREEDSAIMSLIKGGLRAITGLIGKRSRPESYRLRTPTATIGIRGTHYGALMCQDDCLGGDSGIPELENGLYVEVADGGIVVGNDAGSQDFDAGQFGYIRDLETLPQRLPQDPGIELVPPAGFDRSAAGADSQAASAGPAEPENCVIR